MRGLRSVRRFLQPVALEQLDDAAVAQRSDLRVERDAPEHLEAVLRRHLIDVALAEHLDRLAAVRALDVAVILDQAEHRHVHHLRHFDRLRDDHGDELLRRGDDDDAVERDGLEHRQRRVAGSGRQVDEHAVHLVPDHVAPELLDDAGDHRAAPDDRRGLVFEQEVDAHDLDAALRVDREKAVLAALRLLVHAEALRDRRAGHVRVEDRGLEAAALHRDSQHGGDEALADAALAADDADDLFHLAHLIHWREKALRLLAGGAVLAAARAVVRAVFAHILYNFFLKKFG